MLGWLQFRLYELRITFREHYLQCVEFYRSLSKDTKINLLKCCVAFNLCLILVFIRPVSEAIGFINYFMPVSVIQFPPVGVVGETVEKLIGLVVVLFLTFLYLLAVSAIIVSLNAAYVVPDFQSGWFALLALFIGTFVLSMFKIAYPRMVLPFTDGLFMVVIALTVPPNETAISLRRLTLLAWPLLIGLGVVIFVTLAIYPKTGHSQLKKTYYSTLTDIKEQYHILVNSFVDTSAAVVATSTDGSTITTKQSVLSSLRLGTRYEIFYSRFSRPGFRKSTHDLRLVVQHLNGIRSVTEAKQSLIEKQIHLTGLYREADSSPETPKPAENSWTHLDDNLSYRADASQSHQVRFPDLKPDMNSASKPPAIAEDSSAAKAGNPPTTVLTGDKPSLVSEELAKTNNADIDIFEIGKFSDKQNRESELGSMARVKSLAPVLERMKSQRFQHGKKASISLSKHQKHISTSTALIEEVALPRILIQSAPTPPLPKGNDILVPTLQDPLPIPPKVGAIGSNADLAHEEQAQDFKAENKHSSFKAMRKFINAYETIRMGAKSGKDSKSNPQELNNMDLLMASSSSLRRRPYSSKVNEPSGPDMAPPLLTKAAAPSILIKSSSHSRNLDGVQAVPSIPAETARSGAATQKHVISYGEPLSKRSRAASLTNEQGGQRKYVGVPRALLEMSAHDSQSTFSETLSVSRNKKSDGPRSGLDSSLNGSVRLSILNASLGHSSGQQLSFSSSKGSKGVDVAAAALSSSLAGAEVHSDPGDNLKHSVTGSFSNEDLVTKTISLRDGNQLTVNSTSLPYKPENKKQVQEALKKPLHMLEPMQDCEVLFPMIDAFSQPVLKLASECEYALETIACFVSGKPLPTPPDEGPLQPPPSMELQSEDGGSSFVYDPLSASRMSTSISASDKEGSPSSVFPSTTALNDNSLSSSMQSDTEELESASELKSSQLLPEPLNGRDGDLYPKRQEVDQSNQSAAFGGAPDPGSTKVSTSNEPNAEQQTLSPSLVSFKKGNADVSSSSKLFPTSNSTPDKSSRRRSDKKRDKHLKVGSEGRSSSFESSIGRGTRLVSELLGHVTGYFGEQKRGEHTHGKLRGELDANLVTEADVRVFIGLSARLSGALEAYQQMHWKKVQNYYNSTRKDSSAEGLGEELAMIYFFAYCLQEFTKSLLQMLHGLTDDMDPKGDSRLRLPHLSDWETVFDPTRVWMGLKRSQFTNKLMYSKGTTLRSKFVYWSHLTILKLSNTVKSYEFKFALKCAVACVLIAIPANASASSSHFFTKNRLNWILVTIVLVMQPTAGGSVYVSLYRIIGTIAGAVIAYLTTIISHNNPYWYTVVSVFYCVPWFYVMLKTSHIRLGMTALLTMPVILGTDYNQYNINFTADPQSSLGISVQRLAATLLGIACTMILSLFVWPLIVHVKLRTSIANTIFTLAYVYSHIIALRMTMNPTDKAKTVSDMNKTMDKIQRVITMHDSLISLADHEFSIKQPFDTNIFIGLNLVCQDILTQLLCFSSLLSADFGESFFANVIWPVNVYRRDVFAAITVNFHVISNALATKSPLPPYLPNIRAARHILMTKLRALPAMQPSFRVHTREDHTRFLYFYAYSLALRELTHDIQLLAALAKELVGEDDYMKIMFERDE